MNIIVLGGTGFLGSAIKKVKPEWNYLGTKNINLKNYEELSYFFKTFKSEEGPIDGVINLAANVGGTIKNTDHQMMMYNDNYLICANVLEACATHNVKKLSTALSTCVFPNFPDEKYPISEEDFYGGPLEKSNMGFALAKRAAYELTLLRRMEHRNFTTFTATNLYGPGDNFDPYSGHFVAAVARKVYEATEGSTMEFFGGPDTLRQQMYVDDAAKYIVELFEKYDGALPIFITPKENVTNEEVIKKMIEVSGKDLSYNFNGAFPGKFRKDCKNDALIEICGHSTFTDLKDGLAKTYNFFVDSQSQEG
jgi:GDP-L-fucose synthase